MIERQEVNGRPAVVAYITSDFEPADKASADMAKIIFDDGDVVFVNMKKPAEDVPQEDTLAAWRG